MRGEGGRGLLIGNEEGRNGWLWELVSSLIGMKCLIK